MRLLCRPDLLLPLLHSQLGGELTNASNVLAPWPHAASSMATCAASARQSQGASGPCLMHGTAPPALKSALCSLEAPPLRRTSTHSQQP